MEWVVLALSKPLHLKTPFFFANDSSATHGRYVTINVDNENLISVLYVFKLVRVCVCNRLENTLNGISFLCHLVLDSLHQYRTIDICFCQIINLFNISTAVTAVIKLDK
jgi:hypothetical protein